MLNNGLNCFFERQYLSSSSKRNLNINRIKCTNGLKIDLLLKFLFIENSVNNGLVNEFLLRVYIDFIFLLKQVNLPQQDPGSSHYHG